jgi:actin related protein 2/3 complex subunit 3
MLMFVVLQALINVALDHFAIPGDVSFPLNQAFEAPRDRQDAESLRACVLRFDSACLSLIIL